MTQLGPSGSNAQASLKELQKMGRVRRSYSMVSSLEKLTHKLRSVEQERGQNRQEEGGGMEEVKQSPNVNRVRREAAEGGSTSQRPIMQKRFIGEVTKEVLIVTEDGCYTSRTDQMTGVMYLHKLNDIREVLESVSSNGM